MGEGGAQERAELRSERHAVFGNTGISRVPCFLWSGRAKLRVINEVVPTDSFWNFPYGDCPSGQHFLLQKDSMKKAFTQSGLTIKDPLMGLGGYWNNASTSQLMSSNQWPQGGGAGSLELQKPLRCTLLPTSSLTGSHLAHPILGFPVCQIES